jgi:hypothetical protein
MGTDIDLFVEKRNSAGKWELMFPAPELSEQLHGEWGAKRSYGPDHLPGWAWYSGRNYELFGLLAGVRRDIEAPWEHHRGIPKDSPLNEGELGRSDGHSHSWISLAELKAYDWGTAHPLSGWMSASDYKYFKDNGNWSSYSQGVGGGGIKKVTNEELDKLFEDGTLIEATHPQKPDTKIWKSADDTTSYYTFVEWTEPMEKVCGFFVNKTLPEIEKLGDPEDIRLIYWFDC